MNEVLSADEWLPLAAAHHTRVDALTAGHLSRSDRHVRHPTEDFLWDYYTYRPAQLRRWHPGPGRILVGDAASVYGTWRWYRTVSTDSGAGVQLDTAAFLNDRGATVDFVMDFLTVTGNHAPQYSCFALHEWAMVYRLPEEQLRHQLPLRLGQAGTDAVVEAHPIRCTHCDAFRFFTEPARPRNAFQPTRATQRELDQPGCLHATMDLYRWAYKLSPGIPSDLVADCFELARRIRDIDMAASPYDTTSLGLTPIAIETAAGKAEFVAKQREFVDEGTRMRARLLDACRTLRNQS